MNNKLITFRGHKLLKGWLEYAGRGFKSEGELLRLILTKAALEQASESGVSILMRSILSKKEIAVGIGETSVYAVRLPEPVYEMVKACADQKNKTISEWCYIVMIEWQQYFKSLSDKYTPQYKDTWLPKHGEGYRAQVAEIANVYAQKTGKVLV